MPTTVEALDLLTETVGDLVQEVLVTKESLDAAKTSAEEDAAFADQRATFAGQKADEVAAGLATYEADAFPKANQASAKAGTGEGLMTAERTGQAITAQTKFKSVNTGSLSINPKDIFEYTAIPEWYGTPAAIAADAYAALQAIIDNTEVGRTIYLKGMTYNLSQGLLLKGRKLKGQRGLTRLKMLPTATSARTYVVRMEGAAADYSEIEDIIIDGNRSGRQTSGAFNAAGHGTGGIEMIDVRHCRVRNCPVVDIGCLTTDNPEIRDNGAYKIERSDTATADVFGNIIENADLNDPAQVASFCVRMRTSWENFVAGQQRYFVYGNRVTGIRSLGVGKNVCELVGPDTIFNIIENGTIEEAGGSEALDCDFGASDNIYRNIVIRKVKPRAGRTSFSACRAGTTDRRVDIPSYVMKYSSRNLFENITLADTVITTANFFLRLFSDNGGIDNRLVRPSLLASAQATGSNSNVSGVTLGTIPDITDGSSETIGLKIIEPYFRGATQGIRGVTTKATLVSIERPDIEATFEAIFSNSSMIWDHLQITGGRLKGSIIGSIQNLRRHKIEGVNFVTTSNDTPISLGSAAGALPGIIRNCLCETSGTPTVYIVRSLEDEVITDNMFVGVAVNTALFASAGGRGQFDRNYATGLTNATHKRNFPAKVKGTAAPIDGLWGPSDVVENTTPASGQPFMWLNTSTALVSGAIAGAWTSGQAYIAGAWRSNGGRAYSLVTAGPGNVANAPTHTSGDVTGADGYTWRWRADAVASFVAANLA